MNLSEYISLSAELPYDPEDLSQGSYKVFLKLNAEKTFVLISSKGFVNPTQYPQETYRGLKSYLNLYNLDINRLRIFLDLFEYVGNGKNHIYQWESSNEQYFDKLQLVDLLIDKDVSNLVNQFYKDKWSAFMNSMLSTKDKVELLSNFFVTELMDDHLKNDVIERFSNMLNKSIENEQYFLFLPNGIQ